MERSLAASVCFNVCLPARHLRDRRLSSVHRDKAENCLRVNNNARLSSLPLSAIEFREFPFAKPGETAPARLHLAGY